MGRNSVCLRSIHPLVRCPPKGSEAQLEGSEGLLEGSESLPEGSEGLPGGLGGDGWTDVRMDGRREFLPILQDFVPCRGRCPKRVSNIYLETQNNCRGSCGLGELQCGVVAL